MKLYSDSRSALQAVDNPIVNSTTVALTLGSLARAGNLLPSLELIWVKAHVGTEGNEMADLLAKEGANRQIIDVGLPLSGAYIKEEVDYLMRVKWQDRWEK